jgi:cytochrome P450
MLLLGGHLTVTDQLSNAVHAFLGHPKPLQGLRLEPSLIASAIEEVLRFEPPSSFVHRVAAVDPEFGRASMGERVGR